MAVASNEISTMSRPVEKICSDSKEQLVRILFFNFLADRVSPHIVNSSNQIYRKISTKTLSIRSSLS